MELPSILRWLGLGISVIGSVIMGIEVSFSVVALDLKTHFNLKQTDVELVSSIGLAGIGLSIFEPFFTKRFGYKLSYIATWILTTGSCLSMWVATLNKDFVAQRPSIIYALQFLLGASVNCASLRMMAIAVTNISKRHSGKLVAVFFSCSSFSKLYYGFLFDTIFQRGLEPFFFTLSLIMFITTPLCFFLHRPVSDSNTELEKVSVDSQEGENDERKPLLNNSENMLHSPLFHLTIWPAVILYAIMYTSLNNITSIAYSIGMANPVYTVYAFSLTVLPLRLVTGVLLDKYSSNFWVLLTKASGTAFAILGYFLQVFYLTQTTLFISSVCLGLCTSVAITVPSTFLTVQFGKDKNPYITGFFYAISGIFALIFHSLFGFFYDLNQSADGFCYGDVCFTLASVILLFIICLIFSVELLNFFLNGTKKLRYS